MPTAFRHRLFKVRFALLAPRKCSRIAIFLPRTLRAASNLALAVSVFLGTLSAHSSRANALRLLLVLMLMLVVFRRVRSPEPHHSSYLCDAAGKGAASRGQMPIIPDPVRFSRVLV